MRSGDPSSLPPAPAPGVPATADSKADPESVLNKASPSRLTVKAGRLDDELSDAEEGGGRFSGENNTLDDDDAGDVTLGIFSVSVVM